MSYELRRMIARIDEELYLIEQSEGPLAVFDATYGKLKKKRQLLMRVLARFERIEKRMGSWQTSSRRRRARLSNLFWKEHSGMAIKYEIRDVVSDYGIYENGELKLIVNSRANAEYIKAILEVDSSRPNATPVYEPKVADMSDEEVLAVMRLCCAEGYHCKECPLHGSSDGCTFEDIDRRVLEMAEKWLDARHAPKVADMSDAEVLAVFRLCCAEGYLCEKCPLNADPDVCKHQDMEYRLIEMAEKWLDARHAPIRTVQTEEKDKDERY